MRQLTRSHQNWKYPSFLAEPLITAVSSSNSCLWSGGFFSSTVMKSHQPQKKLFHAQLPCESISPLPWCFLAKPQLRGLHPGQTRGDTHSTHQPPEDHPSAFSHSPRDTDSRAPAAYQQPRWNSACLSQSPARGGSQPCENGHTEVSSVPGA